MNQIVICVNNIDKEDPDEYWESLVHEATHVSPVGNRYTLAHLTLKADLFSKHPALSIKQRNQIHKRRLTDSEGVANHSDPSFQILNQ